MTLTKLKTLRFIDDRLNVLICSPCGVDKSYLTDWLIELGVTPVAMESTGVYWVPVYEVLEEPEGQEKIRELHEKIGELTVERDFLERTLGRFTGPSGKR